jgi:hypothetical protein
MASRKTVAGTPGLDPSIVKVPLKLNGKTYHLNFSFNGIATAEALTGLKLLGCIDLQNLSATQYRALLYSTLLDENPDISIGEVGSLINLKTLPEITIALVHAWTGSRPAIVAEEGEANPPVEQPS